ncbi:MAG: phytoene/squalene synthase family protein [Bacteroidales bacterium]|nr:phytoene/squalene synthase family protein [Bacteroidales bacterium]
MDLYLDNALDCSEKTTKNYSTSFSLGVRLLGKPLRRPIYAVYGFVRFADEIVDTFHNQNRKELISKFEAETFEAINKGFSSNPILHSFQWAVKMYSIEDDMIKAFLRSMRMDLCPNSKNFSQNKYHNYIYGSAEVVGLMCLKVFTHQEKNYDELVHPARKLGEAFQKVNFLRDIKSDLEERDRFYFPGVNFDQFNNASKKLIEKEIQADFDQALTGIRKLNKDAKLGVYLAYIYYQKLFDKIKRTDASQILKKRYRISNSRKMVLLAECYLRVKLGKI